MKTLTIFLLLLILPVVPQAFSEDNGEQMKTVVYPLLFGDPAAMESISKSIVDDEGHVVLDSKGKRLIIVTTPSRHARLNEVLGQADLKTDNVRIDVQFRSAGRQKDSGFSISGGGGVVIGPNGTSGTITINPEIHNTTTDSSGNTMQSLLVASGREATLRVGESVPYIEWISDFGWQGGYTETQIQWQEVGSFLIVQPVILGDGTTINIRLTPELRGLVDGNPHRTKFAALTTEVMIRDGESMSIGGTMDDREFYSKFLVGTDRSGVSQSLDIILTPRIMKAGPPPVK